LVKNKTKEFQMLIQQKKIIDRSGLRRLSNGKDQETRSGGTRGKEEAKGTETSREGTERKGKTRKESSAHWSYEGKGGSPVRETEGKAGGRENQEDPKG
jgi:hypothetical protein